MGCSKVGYVHRSPVEAVSSERGDAVHADGGGGARAARGAGALQHARRQPQRQRRRRQQRHQHAALPGGAPTNLRPGLAYIIPLH